MGSIGNLKLIAVTPENYWHLKNLGKAGDSFNDVVTRILKELKAVRIRNTKEVVDKTSKILAAIQTLRLSSLFIDIKNWAK